MFYALWQIPGRTCIFSSMNSRDICIPLLVNHGAPIINKHTQPSGESSTASTAYLKFFWFIVGLSIRKWITHPNSIYIYIHIYIYVYIYLELKWPPFLKVNQPPPKTRIIWVPGIYIYIKKYICWEHKVELYIIYTFLERWHHAPKRLNWQTEKGGLAISGWMPGGDSLLGPSASPKNGLVAWFTLDQRRYHQVPKRLPFQPSHQTDISWESKRGAPPQCHPPPKEIRAY